MFTDVLYLLLLGRRNFPPLQLSRVLMAGLIIKLTEDRLTREKERILLLTRTDLIETRLKKCPKASSFFILYTNNDCKKLTG